MSANLLLSLLLHALGETIYMVAISGMAASLLGLPLGMFLFTTRPGGIIEHRTTFWFLSAIVNTLRSVPFIILLVAIVPFTRFIVGTSIGTNAAIVPLVIGAFPFIARIVENALQEVPQSLIEAAQSMGATPWQIMWKFLLPESLPGIVNGLTVTLIALIGYSAMAGAVGGGGLGDLGIRYGYQRFDMGMMAATVIVLVALVQCVQWLGDYWVVKLNKR